jgi:hypothetical protein
MTTAAEGARAGTRAATLFGVFCTRCGHQNPAGAGFCSSCGTLLPAGPDETVVLSVVGSPAEGDDEEARELPGRGEPTEPELQIRRGPDAGASFVLEAEVTRVGRHPDSEILLDDITVSRRHAEFSRRGEEIVVRDVGSLNGTYVNRERIEEAALADGDEVQIGRFKLLFRAATATERA